VEVDAQALPLGVNGADQSKGACGVAEAGKRHRYALDLEADRHTAIFSLQVDLGLFLQPISPAGHLTLTTPVGSVSQTGAVVGKLGAVGFCFGGGIVNTLATRGRREARLAANAGVVQEVPALTSASKSAGGRP
jgi:hypothetical protein